MAFIKVLIRHIWHN